MRQTVGQPSTEKKEVSVEADEVSQGGRDFSDTDALLDEIEEILEDQEKMEFKAKLKGWAKNQRRLAPYCDMYKIEVEHGGSGDCKCCGWPLDGPPGPECIARNEVEPF